MTSKGLAYCDSCGHLVSDHRDWTGRCASGDGCEHFVKHQMTPAEFILTPGVTGVIRSLVDMGEAWAAYAYWRTCGLTLTKENISYAHADDIVEWADAQEEWSRLSRAEQNAWVAWYTSERS